VHGRSEMAELLLEHGADPNKGRGTFDGTPLHAWTKMDCDYARDAVLLLDHGADPNARDDSGETPLHKAVRHGRSFQPLLLLSRGADVNARNNQGETPLHSTWYPEVATILLDHGADVNAVDRQGRTPIAKWAHKPNMVALLRAHGGKPARRGLQ